MLQIAHSYHLQGLKDISEEAVVATIDENNATDRLLIAEQTSSPKLKAAILRYIAASGEGVDFLKGQKWEKVMRDNTKLAMETYATLFELARLTVLSHSEATDNIEHMYVCMYVCIVICLETYK